MVAEYQGDPTSSNCDRLPAADDRLIAITRALLLAWSASERAMPMARAAPVDRTVKL
jgi:hypothetical protein